MRILDDEEDLRNNDIILIRMIAERILDDMISPLLQKQKIGSTEPMPRIGFEITSSYTMPFVGSGGVVKNGVGSINFREYLDRVLLANGEKELKDMVSRIDCRKVNRMRLAVDFVITALIHKSPVILIENINELPKSPRRKDIEGVLIHSWAKNEFVFLDYIYDTRPPIVIFTSRPSNEIGSEHYPVWDKNDNYQWYGDILKEISYNGVVDRAKFYNKLKEM